MRELTIDGRRIADDEKAYLENAKGMEDRWAKTGLSYSGLQILTLEMLVDEVRIMNRLLERIVPSTNERRSDDDA